MAVVFAGVWLKILINDKGSSQLGRTVTIEGPLAVHWRDAQPYIHAENIRLANMPGAAEPDMLQIGQLDMTLDLWKLLRGRLTIPSLHINDLHIVLEKKDSDHANWELPAFSQAKAVTGAVLPKSRSGFPVIGELAITKGVLVYRDDMKKLNVKLDVDTVSGSGGQGDRGLTLAGQGTLQGKTFDLKASGGSINMLRDTKKDYPLQFHIQMGDTVVDMNGTFTDPVNMSGVNASLKLHGANLADLFYLTGIPLPPTPPYSLEGTLLKKQDVWSYAPFNGKVGQSDLAGSIKYDTSGKRGIVEADLNSQRLDIDDLRGFIGSAPSVAKNEAVSQKQKAQAAAQAASPYLLPDVPIDLDRLRAADMDVRLKAAKIDAGEGWPLEAMDVRFDLEQGLLRIDPLKFGVAGGSVEGMLTLDGRQDTPHVAANIGLKRISFGKFFTNPQFKSLSEGVFGGHIGLSGNGRSLAAVMAQSNGQITLIMGGGKISLLIVELASTDVQHALPLLLGDDKTTPVRCGVGDFKVSDGVLNSDIFVFDTGSVNFTGDAKINMRNETIDATIHPHPKDKSLLAIGTPIRVTGPLKDPSAGLDPTKAAARTGAAVVLGSLLTPIVGIIPFIELGMGKDSDCKNLIAQARASSTAPAEKH